MTSRLNQIKAEVGDLIKNDPAHDFSHVMRVYKNARMLCKKEQVSPDLVLTAVLLHDIVSFKKSDPRNASTSTKSALEAEKILRRHKYTGDEITLVCDAIRDHSFSKNTTPATIQGKILQDADRLDAIGAIGIARVFAVAGAEARPLYHMSDPFCQKRTPDDHKWTVDHFYKKLLKLEKLMNTKTGKLLAREKTQTLENFLTQLKKEI